MENPDNSGRISPRAFNKYVKTQRANIDSVIKITSLIKHGISRYLTKKSSKS